MIATWDQARATFEHMMDLREQMAAVKAVIADLYFWEWRERRRLNAQLNRLAGLEAECARMYWWSIRQLTV